MTDSYACIALVNPRWDFEGSRYWACTEPHLPLELLYTEALLKKAGVEAAIVDAHLEQLSREALTARVADLKPDLIVLTTAPTYLFWRCPPPELGIPVAACKTLRAIAPVVAVGPHGSATPGYVLKALGCQAVVRGEPEMEIVRLAQGHPGPATVWAGASGDASAGMPATVDMALLPTLDYAGYPLALRTHRHHVFWGEGRGAEVEYSRGCPYGCSFCNRRYFRGRFRSRPVASVLSEIGALNRMGVDYVYFIDEVFGLGSRQTLLDQLAAERLVQFGCQTRLDLWDERRLDHLAAAGCVSVEFGLESPFPNVQHSINKGYQIDGDRILDLMAYAKSIIPWVQGDLIEVPGTDPDLRARTEDWRQAAIARGLWVSEPVSLFLYPGSDLHDEVLGPIDDGAWVRAMEASQE
jgi:anaerobic magnesium-protoporphyrin IX monomethyl ester cyclase